MLKSYIQSVVQQLRIHSTSLEKTNIIINKPWALIDEEHEMQKLIFKKDKQLILSKNGQVQIGQWDYFPEAKSLLIDRNTDKILCNEAFIDEGILILRLDGTDNRFFILANENVIPDLDVTNYLKNLRYKKLNILEKQLADGRILEISRSENGGLPQIGNKVTIEAGDIDDGIYELAKQNDYYEINKGRIKYILTEIKYMNPNNLEITIQQKDPNLIWFGDYVFIKGIPAEDQTINFTKTKNLVIRGGKVIRLERKNKMMRYISKLYHHFVSNNYYE